MADAPTRCPQRLPHPLNGPDLASRCYLPHATIGGAGTGQRRETSAEETIYDKRAHDGERKRPVSGLRASENTVGMGMARKPWVGEAIPDQLAQRLPFA
jgi:hypothetical protein